MLGKYIKDVRLFAAVCNGGAEEFMMFRFEGFKIHAIDRKGNVIRTAADYW